MVYELARNGSTDPEDLAEAAFGMALDNGADMLDTNPEEHAASEYEGYIDIAMEIYEEVYAETHDEEMPEDELDELRESVKKVAPSVGEELGVPVQKASA